MKRSLALVLSAVALVGFATAALGQQKCHDFRALYHMTLWVDLSTGTGGWYPDVEDPIRALLDENPVRPTVIPTLGKSWGTGVAGHDRNGSYVWDLGGGDTFTVTSIHATYPNPPGKAGLFAYNSNAQITAGTGRFENASGTAAEGGPTWSGRQ